MTKHNVHIRSFGCQMNKLDTALVSASLKEAGFGLTDDVKDADVVVINTCSVREHAEARVLSHLGHLKHLKKHRPGMVVSQEASPRHGRCRHRLHGPTAGAESARA